MAYQLDYFTTFQLPGHTVEAVRAQYAAWILGHGKYFSSQKSRREVGVLDSWSVRTITAAKSLHGREDLVIEGRTSPGVWMLRYRHRNAEQPTVFFEHQIRLTESAEALTVEHGIRRSAWRDELGPISGPVRPRIVRDLVTGKDSPSIVPKNLDLDLVHLREGEVDGFVSSVLFEAHSVPWVLVSPAVETGTPFVDPRLLVDILRGMAAVAVLETVEASKEMTRALERRRLSPELRCFDGAIRAYSNKEDAGRLPFLMRERLEQIDPAARTWRAAGELTRRLAERAMPAGFFSTVDEHDEKERQQALHALKDRIAAGSVSEVGQRQVIQELETHIAATDQEIKELKNERDQLREANEYHELEMDEERKRSDHKLRTVQYLLDQERQEATRLRLEGRSGEAAADTLCVSVKKAIQEDLDPLGYLRLVAELHGDRLVVLPSAENSAKRAEKFKYPKRAADLLFRLATDYYDQLVGGGGDAEARRVFGKDEYSAKEAKLSTEGIRLRTFQWNGDEIFMEKHLKHGVKESDAECFRVHFEWIPDRKVIVIGHCGGHLNL